MLGHRHGHHRQLLDLMTHRRTDAHALDIAEAISAATSHGPMLGELVDRPRGQQRPALALMAQLRALLAPRPVLATLGRQPGRSALGGCDELRDERPTRRSSSAIRSSCAATRFSKRDLLIHPQQHRDHRITTLVIDRLGLGPLHTTTFDNAALCPPTD